VALAIAIAIDPHGLADPRSKAPPVEEPPSTAPPPALPTEAFAPRTDPAPAPKEALPAAAEASPTAKGESPSPAKTASPTPIVFEQSLGVVASDGFAPDVALGVEVGAAVRWRAVSVALEGRIDAPASAPARGEGEVSTWIWMGQIVPCAYGGAVFGCALLEGGSMQAQSSGVPARAQAGIPWWAAGVRAGVLVRLREAAWLRLRADVVANLNRKILEVNNAEAWKAPPVAGSLGIDAVLRFR
jgi:hypothetical protein